MFTQCPHCSTIYPVEPAQLAEARGRLCCGACGNEFSALERLAESSQQLADLPPATGEQTTEGRAASRDRGRRNRSPRRYVSPRDERRAGRRFQGYYETVRPAGGEKRRTDTFSTGISLKRGPPMSSWYEVFDNSEVQYVTRRQVALATGLMTALLALTFAGAVYTQAYDVPGVVAGGASLATDDPAGSALDVNCKAHDLDNLYVVDTSFFPSSSAVNPALTAMANAMRVGDHLLDRLGVSTPQVAGARA